MDSQRQIAQRNLLPHYTKGAAWKSDSLPIMERAEGCYIWDTEGNKYLDGLAGLFCTNIGHGRADFARVAAEQMEKLAFYSTWGFAHPPAIDAASLIADRTPGDLDEIFFVNSGSEAVESATKFARNYHMARGDDDRYKVIARDWAYHGTTLGALSITGIPKFRKQFKPMLWDGVRHVMHTCHDEIPEGGTAADLASVRAIEEMILAEGPETVAMVIAEPVQNGRGAVVPPPGYWQELRKICDKYGVLLCADEVINSFGRLGHWFGSERFDVVPDMITFAKGVTSAYQPLGGVAISRRLVDEVWDSEIGMFNHGSTFGGHPVATAVAAANIRAMEDEGVLQNVLNREDELSGALNALGASHRSVSEVRGCGYFYAVELTGNSDTGQELSETQIAGLQGGVLNKYVRESKLLIRPDDRGATMLTISPPLIADSEVISDMTERLDQILTNVDAWLKTND